jgi:thiamine-phosphate pyrophosphorylase
MTAAQDLSVFDRIRIAKLYAVTPDSREGAGYEARVREALAGGADVIQLRNKTFSSKELLQTARLLKVLCERHGALFIVNDRIDIALASGADGVHLGQDDLPLAEAKRLVNRNNFLIGCSTHSLEQALQAEADGAHYVGCGPIFATPTKPDHRPHGLDLVRQYHGRLKIPFVAIGGIDAGNISQVTEAGARCAAVVRAAFETEDIQSAVRSLKEKLA